MLSEKRKFNMNPKLVFWVPAALRSAIILGACATLGWLFGWVKDWCWRWAP
jgi:hypothetical protein